MIIEFKVHLDRRRASFEASASAGVDLAVNRDGRQAMIALFMPRTSFDDAPIAFKQAFKDLWPKVHRAIQRDPSPIDTERRLGLISNLVLNLIDTWAENLKSFLWRKDGEGCISAGVLAELFKLIERAEELQPIRPRSR